MLMVSCVVTLPVDGEDWNQVDATSVVVIVVVVVYCFNEAGKIHLFCTTHTQKFIGENMCTRERESERDVPASSKSPRIVCQIFFALSMSSSLPVLESSAPIVGANVFFHADGGCLSAILFTYSFVKNLRLYFRNVAGVRPFAMMMGVFPRSMGAFGRPPPRFTPRKYSSGSEGGSEGALSSGPSEVTGTIFAAVASSSDKQ